ncbi:amino acid permease [Corynebacterium imitans]|uniref:Aromatic amino acid transporter n=2 Tax=Corynebacterium imitans TaxID=156978 RepID=A0A076NQJ6_9CORY|nr:amino acid permease [Corynebacterium imitans]AIJ33157.1 aromatic amino acid transporter [Corynebacterium imitans]
MSEPVDPSVDDGGLKRGVKTRHMLMIAMGSSIGTGLFLGSAESINYAGPAVLLGFVIVGAIVYLLMRMLGEMAVAHPVSGSFAAYARDFIGPRAGFIVGWNWWFTTIVVGMIELTAMGTFLDFWFPEIPHWLTALVTLAIVVLINAARVSVFAEAEYWLSLIKVVALSLMIILGIVLVLGLGPEPAVGTENLFIHGGFFPNGATGVLFSLVAVTFTFGGIMSIGTAAGEAENPSTTIPRAVNSVIWRILLFYLGGMSVILLLAPWDEQGDSASPFVRVLTAVGVDGAAHVLNLVILVAVASVCNTMTYSGSRMLRDLARNGQAPEFFGATTKKGLPLRALLFDAALMGTVVILNYFFEGKVFAILLAIIVGSELITWASISFAHLRFRANGGRSSFMAPFYPYANWLCAGFYVLVLVLMAFLPDYRVGLGALIAWVVGLSIIGATRKQSA